MPAPLGRTCDLSSVPALALLPDHVGPMSPCPPAAPAQAGLDRAAVLDGRCRSEADLERRCPGSDSTARRPSGERVPAWSRVRASNSSPSSPCKPGRRRGLRVLRAVTSRSEKKTAFGSSPRECSTRPRARGPDREHRVVLRRSSTVTSSRWRASEPRESFRGRRVGDGQKASGPADR